VIFDRSDAEWFCTLLSRLLSRFGTNGADSALELRGKTESGGILVVEGRCGCDESCDESCDANCDESCEESCEEMEALLVVIHEDN
jgi:hypothetical protein